jgi:hypothetical protein
MDSPLTARRQTTPIKRTSHYSGSLVAQQNLVPRLITVRISNATLPLGKGPFYPWEPRQARGGRTVVSNTF